MRPATAQRARRDGFTLVELAVALLVVGLIVAGLFTLLPVLTERLRLDRTVVGFEGVDEAITGFALMNNRLPCPDTDGDGVEGSGGGCGAGDVVGEVPYASVGLPGPAVDEARLPLRYAVYRNAGADADLATLSELFEPALPGELDAEVGSVESCNVTEPNRIRIVYDSPDRWMLTFSGASGSFKEADLGVDPPVLGEYVGGAWIDHSGPMATMPPYMGPGMCPCGEPMPQPDPGDPVCSLCTDFLPGEVIERTVEIPDLPTDDDSTATVDSIETPGATINVGLPNGSFEPGDKIFGQTSYYAATVDAFTSPIVQVYEVSGSTAKVELIPDEPDFPGFRPSQKLFGAETGTTATFVSLTPPVVASFTAGETVTGGTSGATGTVVSDTGALLTLTVTGGAFVVGETITGGSSGKTGTIVSIQTEVFADPVITRGTISWGTPPVSGATNKLDYCVGLRNAIREAGTTGSAGFPYTVNPAAVAINPAYLLVSGGVEDANGGGADFAFDGLNEIADPLDYVSPAPGRDEVYDDLVFTAPIRDLEERFCCAENLGAVNAMAVDATVAQNFAIITFYRNEQALQLVDQSYQALRLAEASRDISIVQFALEVLGAAVTVTHLAMHLEAAGPLEAAEFVATVAALAEAIIALTEALGEVDDAKESYADACTSQAEAEAAVGPALAKAQNALNRALAIDAAGGVK